MDSVRLLAGRRRRRWTYALAGAILGIGAPVGLLALRSLLSGTPPWRLLPEEMRSEPTLYLYLTVSTVLVFSVFGWILGFLHDQQRREALTDPLTGLANRRQFHLLLDEAIARTSRSGDALSVLLFDVDGLKRINDEEGHAAGDAALRAVAEALRAGCRRGDVPARISGDEFAVLALGAESADAVLLAGRIRAALAAGEPAPRVSVGVVSRVGPVDVEPADLLRVADGALYEAKTAGRDRVVVARE